MSQKDKLSTDTLIFLREQGINYGTISAKYGPTEATLRKRVQRYREIAGLPPKEVIKSSSVTAYWGLQIKESIHEEPLLSIRDRFDFLDPPFSISTMYRYMVVNSLVVHKRQERIIFTERHKQDRLDFARRMLDHFDNDYLFGQRIIWSDEKYFRVGNFGSQPV